MENIHWNAIICIEMSIDISFELVNELIGMAWQIITIESGL